MELTGFYLAAAVVRELGDDGGGFWCFSFGRLSQRAQGKEGGAAVPVECSARLGMGRGCGDGCGVDELVDRQWRAAALLAERVEWSRARGRESSASS